ncbi:nucleotidyltransferase family protein [Segetibacter sp. 3557_3]|nr:nucleotidyltransferase family protein [Segetibacter sp. 3557_3]
MAKGSWGSSAVSKAMILAAGLGTRLKPWTDQHPKALAEVNGKSLLQLNIEYLQQFNITDVVVNVHHFADQIVEAIDKNRGWGSQVTISDETSAVLETGGGLVKAAPHFPGGASFVLMNVDILTDLDLSEMIDNHLEYLPLATLATTKRTTSRYLLFDKNNTLVGWKNVATGEIKGLPEATRVAQPQAFSGIHLIDPAIFTLIKREGKFSMVDVYLNLMHSNHIRSFDHSAGKFIDVGKPESIVQAQNLFS